MVHGHPEPLTRTGLICEDEIDYRRPLELRIPRSIRDVNPLVNEGRFRAPQMAVCKIRLHFVMVNRMCDYGELTRLLTDEHEVGAWLEELLAVASSNSLPHNAPIVAIGKPDDQRFRPTVPYLRRHPNNMLRLEISRGCFPEGTYLLTSELRTWYS